MITIIYSILFINIIYAFHQKESCYENKKNCYIFDQDITKHLGTKTPYRIVANKKDSTIKYEDCHPVKIVGITRHGTRTPGLEAIEEIRLKLGELRNVIQKLNSIHDETCEYDFERIKNWKLSLDNEGDKILTNEGEDEMIKLAHRLKNRFPSLLKEKYSNNSYYFRFTNTQRTRESAKFFTMGLFGNETGRDVWFPEALSKDPILRFYKLCDKWRAEVKKNPNSLDELKRYIQSEEVENMIKRVSLRIGLNYTLTYEDIRLMYVTCSFETAWSKSNPSAWCSVFSKKDIKVLEYAEELKYYWIDGYGYDINHNQACPLINNIFEIFINQDGPKSVFYFTHSGTILKTISHLGLYKDKFKLTHNIQSKLRSKRNWKISKIDSFSANLIFVLFRCKGDELNVLLLHQEKILRFPGCDEHDLCPLKKLKEIYSNAFKDCDFADMCKV